MRPETQTDDRLVVRKGMSLVGWTIVSLLVAILVAILCEMLLG